MYQYALKYILLDSFAFVCFRVCEICNINYKLYGIETIGYQIFAVFAVSPLDRKKCIPIDRECDTVTLSTGETYII